MKFAAVYLVFSALYMGILRAGSVTSPSSNRYFPTSEQAANISRARVFYYHPSGVGSSIHLFGLPEVNLTVQLSGTVNIVGILAQDLEAATQNIAKSIPKGISFHVVDFFVNETESLKSLAKENYYTFFQAAALYGFSSSNDTQRSLKRKKFQIFSQLAAAAFEDIPLTTFSSNYNVSATGTVNRSGILSVYIPVSEITIMSGKVITIVKEASKVVVAFEDGQVFDIVENGVSFTS